MEQGRVLQIVVAIAMAALALPGHAAAQTNSGAPATWLDGCWGSRGGNRRLTITQQPGGITVTSVDGRESGFWRYQGYRYDHPVYYLESGYRLYARQDNHDYIEFHGAVEADLYRVSGACPATANSRSRPNTAPAAPAGPAVASRPAAPPRAPSGPAAATSATSPGSALEQQWASARAAVAARNYPEAARLLAPLAARGIPPAQAAMAILLYQGQGVPQDGPAALTMMGDAAEQGFQPAIEQLARWERQQARLAAGGPGAAAGGSPTAADPSRSRRILIHNPALEATHCVHIRAHGAPGSRGFTQSIVNECGQVVEATWCYTDGECQREGGSAWTLAASGQGSAYPIGRTAVRYGACLGRNSGGFEHGSQGQRIICTGDAGAPPR
jgi:TPR repeat protein